MLCPNDRPNLSGFFNVGIFVGDLSLSGTRLQGTNGSLFRNFMRNHEGNYLCAKACHSDFKLQ